MTDIMKLADAYAVAQRDVSADLGANAGMDEQDPTWVAMKEARAALQSAIDALQGENGQLHASLQSSRVAFEQVCKHRDALQGENERLLREVVNRNQRALDGDKAVKVLDTTVTELEALRAKLDEWQRQEPVGHFLSNYGEEGLWLCCKAEIKGMTEPLYAAPKALEPLTDDRIGELQVEHLYLSDDGYSIRGQWEFARAIEASHGITKGTP